MYRLLNGAKIQPSNIEAEMNYMVSLPRINIEANMNYIISLLCINLYNFRPHPHNGFFGDQ